MSDQGHDIPIIERLALTREEAAALLGVPPDTIENQTRCGVLQAVQIGKHKRWTIEDLQAYLTRLRDEGSGRNSS